MHAFWQLFCDSLTHRSTEIATGLFLPTSMHLLLGLGHSRHRDSQVCTSIQSPSSLKGLSFCPCGASSWRPRLTGKKEGPLEYHIHSPNSLLLRFYHSKKGSGRLATVSGRAPEPCVLGWERCVRPLSSSCPVFFSTL